METTNIRLTNGLTATISGVLSQYEDGVEAYILYVADKNYIILTGASSSAIVSVNGISYYADSKGRLYIDLTDIARTKVGGEYNIPILYNGRTATISTYCTHGIDPYDMALSAPYDVDASYCDASDRSELQIGLPNIVYRSKIDFVQDLQLPVWRSGADYDAGDGHLIVDDEDMVIPDALMRCTMPTTTRHCDIMLNDSEVASSIELRDADNPILLQWCSMAGYPSTVDGNRVIAPIIKRCIFDKAKGQINSNITALQAEGNGYKQSRTNSTQMTLSIGGLDSYGLWWYTDIINSNEVVAYLHPADTQGHKVRVTDTKVAHNYDIGKSNYTLTITISVFNYG